MRKLMCKGRLAPLLLLSLLLLVGPGCGKKGPVRPKLTTPPSAPEQLTLQQQGNTFVLGWTIPAASWRGGGEEDVTGFRIRRLTYAAVDGCPTCREPQKIVAELANLNPEGGQRIGSRMYWRDLDIRPGSGYRYAVSETILGGQEGPAATIHLAAQQPPPAPTGLHAEAGNARVLIQWTAPALPPGMELLGYNLYRRQSKRPFPIIPVNPSPLTGTRLLDRGLDNGRLYEYRVSALVRSSGELLESLPSAGVHATPREGL